MRYISRPTDTFILTYEKSFITNKKIPAGYIKVGLWYNFSQK